MEIADRYRRLATRFSDLVDAVPAGSWDAPSPCAEWTARDIVAHIVSSEADMLARMPFAPAAPKLDDSLIAWPHVRDLVQAALDTPEQAGHVYDGWFGPTTFAETIDNFYAADLVVHAWDIARATGLPDWEPIPEAEIDRLMASFGPDTPMAAAMRQPGAFGPAIEPPDGADATARLVAWLGRQP